MTAQLPNSSQRQILQRLRIDQWRLFPSLKVGNKVLRRLEINGWIERRIQGHTLELRLTFEGLEALTAKIPMSLVDCETYDQQTERAVLDARQRASSDSEPMLPGQGAALLRGAARS